jgi:hypothetical protein
MIQQPICPCTIKLFTGYPPGPVDGSIMDSSSKQMFSLAKMVIDVVTVLF